MCLSTSTYRLGLFNISDNDLKIFGCIVVFVYSVVIMMLPAILIFDLFFAVVFERFCQK